MIEFRCDRCERTISAELSEAGGKMECPYCGDMNRVPREGDGGGGERGSSGGVTAGTGGGSVDRAVAAGLPPDSGPEVRVMMVRPSIWRGWPALSFGLLLAPAAASIVTMVLVTNGRITAGTIALGIGAVLAWLPLLVWWLIATVGVSLEITNKRTIEHRGLLSRSTSEVLHDHVRNIQIDQTLLDRILGVGNIGISSSGQDGIEIAVKQVPLPGRVKEVIDLYRPM